MLFLPILKMHKMRTKRMSTWGINFVFDDINIMKCGWCDQYIKNLIRKFKSLHPDVICQGFTLASLASRQTTCFPFERDHPLSLPVLFALRLLPLPLRNTPLVIPISALSLLSGGSSDS